MIARRWLRLAAALLSASPMLVPAPALAARPAAPAAPAGDALDARIARILRTTPLIDGHNDLPGEILDRAGSVDGLASGAGDGPHPLMTDMARLRAGRVGGQFWSVYINGELTGDTAIRRTLEQIDIVDRLIRAYPADLERATSADDIVRIHKAGRVASLIGIEGGRQIGGSMAALRQFHRLGARYMTLTHNQTNALADSATDAPRHRGLSDFGRAVIGEMNRLGMMVDLSHVSAETMRQAIAHSAAPVIFSHSSAQGVAAHPRNVPDDVLALLRDKDGVVMINVFPQFISDEVWRWAADKAGEEARLKQLHRADPGAVTAGVAAWEATHPRPATSVATIADHVDRVARVAGHGHVGIGADLDGIPFTPSGFSSVADYPVLLKALAQRGWTDPQLRGLAGDNLLRVMRKAEAVAGAMRSVPPAMTPTPATP